MNERANHVPLVRVLYDARPLQTVSHYNDVIMSAMASQIISIPTACSAVCSGTHERIHQSSVSLAFVRENHRWPVDSSHKGPVMRKIFSFDNVIIGNANVFYSAMGPTLPRMIWQLGNQNKPVTKILAPLFPINKSFSWCGRSRYQKSFSANVCNEKKIVT